MEYLGKEKKINQIAPKVSICVETYQHINFIGECLDSLLSQKTNFPFEIILGEDESKDGTRELCKEYAEKHPDVIRLFLRSQKDVIRINGTATGRFNLMANVKEARGQYIAHCSGDDYWVDDLKLQKQVDYLDAHPDYMFSMGGTLIRYEELGEIIERNERVEMKIRGEFLLKDYIKRGPFSCISTFLYRNTSKQLPDWFIHTVPGDQALVMLHTGSGKIKYHNENFAVYRQSNQNITAHREINASSEMVKEEMFFLLDNYNKYSRYQYDKEIRGRKLFIKIALRVKSIKNNFIRNILLNLFKLYKYTFH